MTDELQQKEQELEEMQKKIQAYKKEREIKELKEKLEKAKSQDEWKKQHPKFTKFQSFTRGLEKGTKGLLKDFGKGIVKAAEIGNKLDEKLAEQERKEKQGQKTKKPSQDLQDTLYGVD